MRERTFEISARTAQPGVHGVERYLQNLSDLGGRPLFELGQDEDLTFRLVELREDGPNQPSRRTPLGVLFRIFGAHIDDFLELTYGHETATLRIATLDASPMVASHTKRDAVDPAENRHGGQEVGKPAVHHQKDVLHGVVQLGVSDTETPEGSPDRARAEVVDLGEGPSPARICHLVLLDRRSLCGARLLVA